MVSGIGTVPAGDKQQIHAFRCAIINFGKSKCELRGLSQLWFSALLIFGFRAEPANAPEASRLTQGADLIKTLCIKPNDCKKVNLIRRFYSAGSFNVIRNFSITPGSLFWHMTRRPLQMGINTVRSQLQHIQVHYREDG